MNYRQIYFCEIAPDRWVSVNVGGPFDSDAWRALKMFLDQTETMPMEAGPAEQHRGEPHET